MLTKEFKTLLLLVDIGIVSIFIALISKLF